MKNLTRILTIVAALSLQISSAHAMGDKPSTGTGGGGAPEPATMALLLAGAGFIGGKSALKKRNRKNQLDSQE